MGNRQGKYQVHFYIHTENQVLRVYWIHTSRRHGSKTLSARDPLDLPTLVCVRLMSPTFTLFHQKSPFRSHNCLFLPCYLLVRFGCRQATSHWTLKMGPTIYLLPTSVILTVLRTRRLWYLDVFYSLRDDSTIFLDRREWSGCVTLITEDLRTKKTEVVLLINGFGSYFYKFVSTIYTLSL